MIWGKRNALVAGSRRRRWHTAETGTVKSTTRDWYRVYSVYPLIFRAAPALFGLLLLFPSRAAAAENEDMAVLRRMLQELKAENRKLSQRLSTLESAPAARRTKPAAHERPTAVATAGTPAPAVRASPVAPPTLPAPDLSETAAKRPLGVRVRDLEVIWAAQENATRQIIRDSLSKTGPKINSFLSLSGVVEGVASRTGSFTGPTQENLSLGTAELDFDIKLSDWLTGALVLHFDNGTGAIFPTGNQPVVPANIVGVGVDRFTLDRTYIAVGDLMQFPIAARFGVEVLHFGTSTGVARLDTLSIGTPLTTEVFENRQTAGGLEFAWPTPPRQPPPAPVVVPRVSPLVVAPAVRQLMGWLGYTPLPERPFRPTPVTFPFDPAPFYGSVMTYRGSDSIIPGRTKIDDYNASLGFRTRGNCGVPYDQLTNSLICPWTVDFHVDYDTSVFESRFLRTSYLPFLNQIGRISWSGCEPQNQFRPVRVRGRGKCRNSGRQVYRWPRHCAEHDADDLAGLDCLSIRLESVGAGDRRAGRFHLGGIFWQSRHGGRVDPAKRHTNPDRIRPATPAFPHRRRVGDGRAEGGRGILRQLGLSGERRRDGQSGAWLVRIDPAQFLIRLRPALRERAKILEASSRQMG